MFADLDIYLEGCHAKTITIKNKLGQSIDFEAFQRQVDVQNFWPCYPAKSGEEMAQFRGSG